MSEQSEDAAISLQSNDSDDETLISKENLNEIELFPKLVEKQNIDLHQSVFEYSLTSKQNSCPILEDELSFKSNKLSSNRMPDYEPTLAQIAYSHLKVLTTNAEKKEIDLFWSCLATHFYELQPKKGTSTKKVRLVSNKSREKSNTLKEGKKSKTKLRKRSKSSEMYRKDETLKSSGETKSAETMMSELVTSIKEMKLPEIKKSDKTTVGEGATASLKIENQVLVSNAKEDIDFYYSFFKENKMASSPSESTDSGTLTPDSDNSESRSIQDQFISLEKSSLNIPFINLRLSDVCVSSTLWELYEKSLISEHAKMSKFPEPPMKSFVFQRCPRSKLLEPCIKLKLSQLFEELKLPVPVEPIIGEYHFPLKFEKPDRLAELIEPDPPVRVKKILPPVSPKHIQSAVSPKHIQSAVSPRQIESSESEKNIKSPLRLKQLDTSVRPKQLDPSVKPKRPKQLDFSARSDLPERSRLGYDEPDFKPKLLKSNKFSNSYNESIKYFQITDLDYQRWVDELKLEAFISLRRLHILKLRNIAGRVKAFMETIALLRQGEPDDDEVIHVQWNMQDAADWVNVLYYWDVVKEDINIMLANINIIFEDLHDEKILPTRKQIHDYMKQFICVYENVGRLYKACRNGMPKCTRFCSSRDTPRFFDYATALIAHVMLLLEKLEVEVQHIETYRQKHPY